MLIEREAIMEFDSETSPSAGIWEGGWPQTRGEFERLVEAFKDRLVRYAYRRLSNLHDAEDVAQEVLVRAYTDRARHKKVKHVSAYLYRMASNRCVDLLRRRKRSGVSLEEVEVLKIPANNPIGSEVAAAAEELCRIESLLSRIPRRQAEVIRLRVFDELSQREIAAVLGWPLATVKSRMRYGLEKLRKIIIEERGVSS